MLHITQHGMATRVAQLVFAAAPATPQGATSSTLTTVCETHDDAEDPFRIDSAGIAGRARSAGSGGSSGRVPSLQGSSGSPHFHGRRRDLRRLQSAESCASSGEWDAITQLGLLSPGNAITSLDDQRKDGFGAM